MLLTEGVSRFFPIMTIFMHYNISILLQVKIVIHTGFWVGLTCRVKLLPKDTRDEIHSWVTEKNKERKAIAKLTDSLSQLWFFALSRLYFQMLAKQGGKAYSNFPTVKEKKTCTRPN